MNLIAFPYILQSFYKLTLLRVQPVDEWQVLHRLAHLCQTNDSATRMKLTRGYVGAWIGICGDATSIKALWVLDFVYQQ